MVFLGVAIVSLLFRLQIEEIEVISHDMFAGYRACHGAVQRSIHLCAGRLSFRAPECEESALNTIEEAARRLVQQRSAGVDTPLDPATGPATPPLEVGTGEHEVAAPRTEG